MLYGLTRVDESARDVGRRISPEYAHGPVPNVHEAVRDPSRHVGGVESREMVALPRYVALGVTLQNGHRLLHIVGMEFDGCPWREGCDTAGKSFSAYPRACQRPGDYPTATLNDSDFLKSKNAWLRHTDLLYIK